MLDKLIAAKKNCGGRRCIVAAGLVNDYCLAKVPLGEFFDALTTAPAIGDFNSGDISAHDITQILTNQLTITLAETCASMMR